ncbi:aromatic amino acid lyase, partial [Actinosynnema sp. NPDC023658]|uniref:aromatic amino acid lyase n=1 Tax=Actinosynnema sp. NPDC023658 TaxID=3155465 RepID=UPI0033F1E9E9
MQQPVQLGPKPLTRDDVHAVARGGARVEITEAAREAVTTARSHIERLATAEQPTYGVSTGFGALAVRHI